MKSTPAEAQNITFAENLPVRHERSGKFPSVSHRHRLESLYPPAGAKTHFGELLRRLFCCDWAPTPPSATNSEHTLLGAANVVQEKDGLGASMARLIVLLRSALVAPQAGEVQRLDERGWRIVYDFDAKRRLAQRDGADLLKEVPALGEIAADQNHPSHEDAKLLMAIVGRPLGDDSSLEEFLAAEVSQRLMDCGAVNLTRDEQRNADFRTFNANLPGLLLGTLDCNSLGRTLLLKGMEHLIGIPSAASTGNGLTETHRDRKQRLERVVFTFPKVPAPGAHTLSLADFNVEPWENDPLDDLNVYEFPASNRS